MLSATAIQNLLTLITALITLVGVVTVLVKQLQQGAVIKDVKTNTNDHLTQLTAKVDALQRTQATAVELQARPVVPPEFQQAPPPGA